MKEKTIKLVKRVLKNELVSGSTYIFIGSVIGNILALVFNLYLARKLTYADYGTYASLLSLIGLITIPAQSFGPIIVQFATQYLSKKEEGKATEFYFIILKIVSLFATVLLVGFIVFSGPLQSFLHINNIWLVIISGLIVFFSYVAVLNMSFTQSLLRFVFLAFLTIMVGIVKVVTGFLFINAGYRIVGSLLAILLSFFIPFLLSFISVAFLFLKRRERIKIPLREILVYAIPTSTTVLALSAFTSTDVLLVKHFFNAHDAGFYAGLSVVGKAIFYFTAPIPIVMFPLLIKRHTQGQNYKNLFYLALLLVFLPSLAITAFYFLFPKITLTIFLGGRDYLSIAPYLGLFALYLSVFSVINVCVNFFLSLKKTNVVYFVLIGAFMQGLGITFFHKGFIQVIAVSLSTAILLLIALLLYYFKVYGTEKPNKKNTRLSHNSGI